MPLQERRLARGLECERGGSFLRLRSYWVPLHCRRIALPLQARIHSKALTACVFGIGWQGVVAGCQSFFFMAARPREAKHSLRLSDLD